MQCLREKRARCLAISALPLVPCHMPIMMPLWPLNQPKQTIVQQDLTVAAELLHSIFVARPFCTCAPIISGDSKMLKVSNEGTKTNCFQLGLGGGRRMCVAGCGMLCVSKSPIEFA